MGLWDHHHPCWFLPLLLSAISEPSIFHCSDTMHAYQGWERERMQGLAAVPSQAAISLRAHGGRPDKDMLCASPISHQNHLSHQWLLNHKEPARHKVGHECLIMGDQRVELQNSSLEVRVWQPSFSDFPEQFQFHAT